MVEQISIDEILYNHHPIQIQTKKQEFKPKRIKIQCDIIPYPNYYIRTKTSEIHKIDRVKKEQRKIYCGHINAYNQYGNHYMKPSYKIIYDVWVKTINDKGALFDCAIYNENIIFQSKWIIDCFNNGDWVKLKNGKTCKVLGWKKGTIKQKQIFKKDKNGKEIIEYEEYNTSVLYCDCKGRILHVRNEDISGIELFNNDIDLLQGGDIVDTIYYGISVVLGVTKHKIHIKQLYPALEEEAKEIFINKAEIKTILYLQAEEE